MKTISYTQYLEKIYAGWAGKSLGGIVGAPIEGHKAFGNFQGAESFPPKLYPNDDLDIQVVWLEWMETAGTDVRSTDLARCWKEHCWYNFAEYGVFLNNYDRGILPPLSGEFNNSFYRESMGCPIRAEIWGMVNPGQPEEASRLAALDGCLDHGGLSVLAEKYWAACIALAFFEEKLEDVLLGGFQAIGKDSALYTAYEYVIELCGQYRCKGLSLKGVWLSIVRKFGNHDASKMMINFAITLAALLIGQEDFILTINTAINMGWDADCTAATAGALLGVLRGEKILPAEWLQKMGERLTCDIDVRHKESTLRDFARDTSLVGLEKMICEKKAGIIQGVPDDISQEVSRRMSGRGEPCPFEVDIEYPEDPVLYRGHPASLNIRISNKTDKTLSIDYRLEPEPHLRLTGETPCFGNLTVLPQDELRIPVHMEAIHGTIPDSNRVNGVFRTGQVTKNIFFGLAGERTWEVYGPYWDIYDRSKFTECPYRNSSENCHPAFKGCFYYLEHQHVHLDDEYLDEKALFIRPLPEEVPVICRTGSDQVPLNQVSAFDGEACYYLVREVDSASEENISLTIGSNSPFRIYSNGEKVIENLKFQSFAPRDFFYPIKAAGKKRIVVKIITAGNPIHFGMSFSVLDAVKDKRQGISYLFSGMRDRIME